MPKKVLEVKGLKELQLLVNNLSPDVKRIINDNFSKFGQSMQNEMTNTVPVRTGFLRKSIGHEKKDQQLKVFAKAHYAGFVDHGTFKMPARPFFSNTLEKQIPQIIKQINKETGQNIKTRSKRGRA